MLHRTHWESRIESAWRERSVVWLAGVRRSGKTTLCQGLKRITYFDCERPRVRRMLDDPESFLEEHKGQRVVLDEIHRLENPSEILKLAADHFPEVRILATGSSTLGASKKFSDTLLGRKRTIWLSPMIQADLADFGSTDLKRRLRRGGLPPFFLAKEQPDADFQEWFDGYWAKDLQELFRLERRHAFQKLTELLFIQSGGLFEAASFAAPCGISRPTVQTYLDVLEATFLVHVLRPFHSSRNREIVAAPKVYSFDTGFIAHHRGLDHLRPEDYGSLWEHYVLNELLAHGLEVRHWRDKAKHEVDFVLPINPKAPVAIEAKWKATAFDPSNLMAFRGLYPEGLNFVVAQDVDRAYTKRFQDVAVRFMNLNGLIKGLALT